MSERVISFEKLNTNNRLDRGKKAFEDGDYLNAVFTLLPVLDEPNRRSVITSAKTLASSYFVLQNYNLSLFFNFLYKETDLFMSNTYLKVAHIYLKQQNYDKAIEYFKRSFDEDGLEDGLTEEILDMIYESRKSFKVISGNEDYIDKVNHKAENLMGMCKYEDSIKLLNELGNFENEQIRSNLCLNYVFSKQFQKAIDLMDKYGQDTVIDLCNLFFLYSMMGNEAGQKVVIDKINKYKKTYSLEDLFRIGLVFGEMGYFKEALNFMTYYSSSEHIHILSTFYYALTCLNAEMFKEAKAKFLDLYNFDYFNRYIYLYYINCCENRDKSKFRYDFDVPESEQRKLRKRVKKYLTIDDEELLKEFKKNKPDFFYLANHITREREDILLRLAGINDDEVYLLTRFLLLNDSDFDDFKLKVLHKIVSTKHREFNAFLSIMYYDSYYNFELPDLDFYGQFIENIREVLFLCLEFIVKFVEPCYVDITTTLSQIVWGIKSPSKVIKFDKAKISFDKNCANNTMACVLCYKILTKLGVKDSFKKILRHFKVTQKDFYEFVDKNKIEID